MSTSIGIKKVFASKISADGSAGYDFVQLQNGVSEGTFMFSGSEPTRTISNNIKGGAVVEVKTSPANDVKFESVDINLDNYVLFMGGSVSINENGSEVYTPDRNQNKNIELTIAFLTNKNFYIVIPRVSIDAYTIYSDDDIHKMSVSGKVLKPTNEKEETRYMHQLSDDDIQKAEILTFTDENQTESSVIDSQNATVELNVLESIDLTKLSPKFELSLGASSVPNSGQEYDYSAPVLIPVISASGNIKQWTVTINGGSSFARLTDNGVFLTDNGSYLIDK